MAVPSLGEGTQHDTTGSVSVSDQTMAGCGGLDLITALTMTRSGEAIGVVRAGQAAGVPVATSFTVETDGTLPSGETLAEAITATDAATGSAPVHYMVNCAHPSHFSAVLDAATEVDAGDPEDFGRLTHDLGAPLPNLRVIGGCSGSDHRHVGAAAGHVHGH